MIKEALKQHSEDRIGLVDYALESSGRWPAESQRAWDKRDWQIRMDLRRQEELTNQDAPYGPWQLRGVIPRQHPLTLRAALSHLCVLPTLRTPPPHTLLSMLLFQEPALSGAAPQRHMASGRSGLPISLCWASHCGAISSRQESSSR